MHKLITILANRNGQFSAEQQSLTYGFIALFFLAAGVFGALAFARARMWKWEALPAIAIIIGLAALYAGRGTVYRMEISPGDAIRYQQIDRGKVATDSNVYLQSFASADMEYRRQDRRIVAVLRDGKAIYPLGEDWIPMDPDQLVVLAAIRQAIGQVPSEPPAARP